MFLSTFAFSAAFAAYSPVAVPVAVAVPVPIAVDVPVAPDPDVAREWLIRELARPEYRRAETTWFDDLVASIGRFLSDLLGGATPGAPSLAWGLVIVALLVGIVASYLIFGPPRLNRRMRTSVATVGEADGRDAATIRAAADAAAAAGDWALATEEMFRAIARGLTERAILTTHPGTTATGFATRAREYFPSFGEALSASATHFDDVRYLGRAGREAAFTEVAALEQAVRAASPRFDHPVPV